jgi:hypothetical protein
MGLTSVLSKYAERGKVLATLGGTILTSPAGTVVTPEINVSALQTEIKQAGQQNVSYFRTCFVLLVILFAGCSVLVLAFINQPSKAGAIFTITGLSFFGIIAQMLKLWKEKIASDLTLALAGTLPPEQLLTALETILKQIRT